MATRKLRWALLSTATINQALIKPLKKAARSELVGVASRDGHRAAAYAQQWGLERSWDNYEALLADPDVDVIYNPLPNSMHASWSVRAAEAGKHVLCEKPMAQSIAEMDALEQAAQANQVTIFEAFMYLHHPQTRALRKMIADGRIGALQTIHSWFNFYLPATDRANVRLQPSLEGGSNWDVGVYTNSMSIVMTGGKAPEAVWAQSIIGESGVDVAMRAQLRFPQNVVAQVGCGFRTPFVEGAWFQGDAGSLYVAEPWKPGHAGKPSTVVFTDIHDQSEEIVFPPMDPYDFEVEAMEACVLDNAEAVVPLALSREFLRTILATYRSAASGEVERP
jgi:predicted dehydrogenase